MHLQSILVGFLLAISLASAEEHDSHAKKTSEIEEGRQIFITNCSACHGVEGKGDGAAAAALDPKPRNFTDAAYMKARPKATLLKVITEGGASVGLSPVMVAWNGTLSHEQIGAVLKYVLTFSKLTKVKAKTTKATK